MSMSLTTVRLTLGGGLGKKSGRREGGMDLFQTFFQE